MPVPVHILSGFLGTGKTTALRAQLEARPGEKVAVIVNDFGEASLDEAALSASEPFRITNIPGGCVCCTAPEGFVAALGAILEEKPDRLMIEPTGLARPQDLVDTIRRGPHREALELAPVVVLVDPQRLDRADGPEADITRHQIESADVVVANRTDLCDEATLSRFDAWAAELWPAPLAVHKTHHGVIPTQMMDWPEGEGPRLPAESAGHDHHAHSTVGFQAGSWKWAPDSVFSRGRLLDALEALQAVAGIGALARFKGIFRTREGVLRLEVAGGVVHQSASSHRRDSRADVILECGGGGGAPGAEAGAEIAKAKRLLDAALLTPAELEAQAGEIEIAQADGRERSATREVLAALPGGLPDVGALFPKRTGEAARMAALWSHLELPTRGSAVIIASDGFASEPVPISALCEGVLIHSVAGKALAPEKGGPFRLMIPEEVADAPSGCANVKGVVRIVLRAAPATSGDAA